MVAIKPGDINQVINKPGKFDAYLIFGPDQGLVSERISTLVKSLVNKVDGKGELVNLLAEDMTNNPDRLSLDLKTISMFGERKILRVVNNNSLTSQYIKNLLLEAPFEADLIIEAGDLKKTNKLRKIFETNRTTAAIACYMDSAKSLKELINEVLRPASLAIDPETESYLISRLGANRALSRNELEKLTLYASGKERITIKDIDDSLTDMSEIAVDEIINTALLGQSNICLNKLNRALNSGVQPTVFFIHLERRLLALHKAALALNNGKTMDSVIKAQRPPLYFQRREIFIKQLSLWREDHLAHAINRAQTTLANARRRNHPTLEQSELANFLLTLARHADRLAS